MKCEPPAIYANGQQIAQTHDKDQGPHLHGFATCVATDCAVGGKWFLHAADGYTIQPGDKLSWRQYQTSTIQSGIDLWFYLCCGLEHGNTDTNGELVGQLVEHNQWVQRTFDLTPYAGWPLQVFAVQAGANTSTGDWDVWFQDVVIYKLDGTVVPVYTRQNPTDTTLYGTVNLTNAAAPTDTVNVPQNASTSLMATTYLTSDHLGSAQSQFAPGGWPLWQGHFDPYGQELTLQPTISSPFSPATDNSRKFTGKERDAESGLDYFGARYYASAMGRFAGPDWSESPAPIPYADLHNPQTLNLYSYVVNNPLSKHDPDGHFESPMDLEVGGDENFGGWTVGQGKAVDQIAASVGPNSRRKPIQSSLTSLMVLTSLRLARALL